MLPNKSFKYKLIRPDDRGSRDRVSQQRRRHGSPTYKTRHHHESIQISEHESAVKFNFQLQKGFFKGYRYRYILKNDGLKGQSPCDNHYAAQLSRSILTPAPARDSDLALFPIMVVQKTKNLKKLLFNVYVHMAFFISSNFKTFPPRLFLSVNHDKE